MKTIHSETEAQARENCHYEKYNDSMKYDCMSAEAREAAK